MSVDWIRRGLDKEGKTRSGLAAHMNWQPSAVTALLKGARQLKASEIPYIAEYLEVPSPLAVDAQHVAGPSPAPTGPIRPPSPPFGPRDLPVYAAVEGGPGEMVVSTDPIDHVPRPWYMGDVRDGFAVLVTGESMSPVYEPGDMVIINPRLPPLTNKKHIFVAETVLGEFKATVKQLVKATPVDWLVKQYNPQSEFALARRVWSKALRIVGKYEA
ncbi:LexA family transcriptional regulator [Chelatococcus reniformis]|uniref:Repressor n=1 Tax=Chelatococcus reniformis TaxID=1494448 RepID=A0A916U6E3_9HYPH|nr:LexA family transcriptional regulator [Chelatococcus reniformis]GGC60406.1 repressor [Chelatococcus reniformis]